MTYSGAMNRSCRVLLVLSVLLLGACRSSEPAQSGSEGASGEASFEARLDALLAQGPEEGYGEREACLGLWEFSRIGIVSDKVMLFSKGSSYWLNTLKHQCLGLKRNMVINTLSRGIESLCSGDDVFASFQYDLKDGLMPSGRPLTVRATCTLGEFQSVPASYGKALEALKP